MNAQLNHHCTIAESLQVPAHFIILKDVVVEDSMESAAKFATFWMTHSKRQISMGQTTLWARKAAFGNSSNTLLLAAPPGAG